METKGKVRSFAEIFGEEAVIDQKPAGNKVEISIGKLIPFKGHPFKLYQGERLQGLVDSIREIGVILPVVVRPIKDGDYEILSGHNRVNAARIAGLDIVPAIIKEGLTEEEANLIVTETNLLQRSFSDLSHSERAIALKRHYDNIKEQSKKAQLKNAQNLEIKRKLDFINEIERLSKSPSAESYETLSQVATKKARPTEKVGQQYALSKDTVARYLRIHELIPALLQRVDNEEIAFIPAVTLSFLKATEQEELERVLGHKKYKINMEKATLLRNHSDSSGLDAEKIEGILSGEIGKKAKVKKHVGVQIKAKVLSRFFKPEQKPEEIQRVIEKALEMYFGSLDND
jgi:ParB family chromosome partitioning protein